MPDFKVDWNNYDKYDNFEYESIVKRVGWGEEFFFYYNGEMYWLAQTEDVRHLSKDDCTHSQEFKTTAELFEKARIDGKSLLEIWDEIKWEM